jgi:hypothetical protein
VLERSVSNLASRSDLELAKAYEETREAVRLAEERGDTATVEHFRALSHAAVEEAASRPDFGAETGGSVLRRRKTRALEELESARRELLAGRGDDG